MGFDLSLSGNVNAAGGVLLVLEGLAILALARGSWRALLVGGTVAAYGATYTFNNLFLAGDRAGDVLNVMAGIPATVLALALAGHLSAGASPSARRALVAFAAVATVAAGTVAASILRGDADALARQYSGPDGLGPLTRLTFTVTGPLVTVAFLILVFSAALAFRRERDTRRRRGILFLGLAFGVWAVAISAWNLGTYPALPAPPSFLVGAAGGALGAVACALAFVPGRGDPEPHLGRRAFLFLVSAGVVASLLVPVGVAQGSQLGIFGVARTFAAAFLALAVVRYDLLGVPLPSLVARRGALATGALAVLFIVAQVAQNFLSAEYGLLTGGVVAGAFLFAAHPLQRLAERLAGGAAPAAAVGRAAFTPLSPTVDEEAYRDAVRLALKDRRFDRREEVALANLADRLGLTAKRATEIRHEIERERGVA